MPNKILLYFLIYTLGILSCQNITNKSAKVILIQPFSDIDPAISKAVLKDIQKTNPNTCLLPAIKLPDSAYYKPRNRYRADVLLKFLGRQYGKDSVVIGLTSKDISTTKGPIYDWGVMGFGYCPGNACVASTFRLSKTLLLTQFYKVAIHELGHTQGLPHCEDNSCYMRDAEGGNPLNEEKAFCKACKTFLISKGWKL